MGYYSLMPLFGKHTWDLKNKRDKLFSIEKNKSFLIIGKWDKM